MTGRFLGKSALVTGGSRGLAGRSSNYLPVKAQTWRLLISTKRF